MDLSAIDNLLIFPSADIENAVWENLLCHRLLVGIRSDVYDDTADNDGVSSAPLGRVEDVKD